MTHHTPFDAFLHAALVQSIRSPTGRATVPSEGQLELPDRTSFTCPRLALTNHLLERVLQARSSGHPDAPPSHTVKGNTKAVHLFLTLPHHLGGVEAIEGIDTYNAVLGQALCTLLDPGHTEAVVEYTRLGHDRDTVAPAFHRHIEWTTGPWLCTADGNRVYVVAETAPSAHTLLHLEKARGRLGTQDLSCLVRPRGGLCNEDPRKDGPP